MVLSFIFGVLPSCRTADTDTREEAEVHVASIMRLRSDVIFENIGGEKEWLLSS